MTCLFCLFGAIIVLFFSEHVEQLLRLGAEHGADNPIASRCVEDVRDAMYSRHG